MILMELKLKTIIIIKLLMKKYLTMNHKNNKMFKRSNKN